MIETEEVERRTICQWTILPLGFRADGVDFKSVWLRSTETYEDGEWFSEYELLRWQVRRVAHLHHTFLPQWLVDRFKNRIITWQLNTIAAQCIKMVRQTLHYYDR